jgi:hypothetical protein
MWLFAAAVAAALPYAFKLAADHDLWWHVRTGQLIVEQRTLPETDPFSFTAAGAPWTNHEWLSDVVAASLFGLGGDRALTVWRVLLLVAVLWALARLLWHRFPHPPFVLAGLLLVTPLVRILINLRPHSYTYLFVLVVLLVWEAARSRPRLLWLLPPLVVLWANLHGGFLLGLGWILLLVATGWLGLDRDGPGPVGAERRRRLAWIAVTSLAAPLVNPYGSGLFTYLQRELGADHSLILEWRGIWSFPGHPEYRAYFALLLLAPGLTLGLARRFRPVGPLVMLGVCATATWVHARFIVLLVLFSSVVTFEALGALALRYVPRIHGGLLARLRRPVVAWTLCAVPLLAAAFDAAIDLRRKGLRLEIATLSVPIEACEFLRAHDLGPHLLLRFDWGGYAIWHLWPEYRISGDGRNLTVYDAAFVDDLLRAYHGGRFGEIARRHDADVILSEAAGPSYEALRRDAAWVRVHEDRLAAIFVRPEAARTLAARRRSGAPAQPATERPFFP